MHAIGGMAGIGKTTFAVHAAHRLAGRFPDGQFFLPLHAHTPGQRAVAPADALASLLLTAGVPAAQIPPGMDARAARWRGDAAGKKILLVLDDAAGHEQVRPLLPGTPGSLVLITSRRRLAALEDAAVVSLDTLAPPEAAGLLARLASRADVTAGDPEVAQIAALCGYLPLAIGMLARQLAHHPAWTPAGLAADLAAARDRLELMRAENLSVAAAFNLSYRDLTAGQRRLFRRIGLHPGPDIDARAAAALDGTGLNTAHRRLEALYSQHLITEPARAVTGCMTWSASTPGRWPPPIPPLPSPPPAGSWITTCTPPWPPASTSPPGASPADSLPPARTPACAPPVATPRQAAAWLEAERANLHAAVGYAASHARPWHAIAIPTAISDFLRANGHWDQALALHQTALAAARQAGDRPGEARALNLLGNMQRLTGDYPAAAATQQQALGMYGDLGDLPRPGRRSQPVGIVQQLAGDYRAAASSHQAALAAARQAGDRRGQAHAANNSGHASAADRGLPGRCRQPPAGAGAVR